MGQEGGPWGESFPWNGEGSAWSRPLPDPFAEARASARRKNYYWSVLVVMALYLWFWPFGVVGNYLFLTEANTRQALAGRPLPGVDCLRWMWQVALVIACVWLISLVAWMTAWFFVCPVLGIRPS